MDSLRLFDHPLIEARYFFPRCDPVPDPFWIDCGDARLACHLQRHDPAARTMVFFHGNGETVADYLADGWPGQFARLGCNLLLIEYRGYGSSSGRPQLGRMIEDVEAIFAALALPEERLVLFGRSVGSLFAIHAASRFPGTAGLILESAIADVGERLLLRLTPQELGVGHDLFERGLDEVFNHRAKLATYPGAVLIMHARGDSLVDVSHGERLHAWATGPKRLHVFSRGDHNDLFLLNRETYFSEIEKFLLALEKRGETA
jgi:uncharacterized protein